MANHGDINAPHLKLVFLLILGFHAVLFKCNVLFSDGEISSVPGSANRIKLTVSGCSNLSGSSSERLGHAALQVYMLRNEYSRTVLPQLLFIRPTWSRIDTVLSARNTSYCGFAVDNTLPLKFPYFGKLEDYDVVTLEYNVTDHYIVERRKFVFFLPFFPRRNMSDIQQWEVFVYVDVTDLHKTTVFWEPAPSLSNITKFQLNITCGGSSELLELENVFLFKLPSHIFSPEMMCQFYIRPWLANVSKWGYRSSSPVVLINRGERLYVWILVTCFLFAALTFLTYRLYEAIARKYKDRVSGSALIIYEAKTEQQLELVCLLAQTLEEDHHIKVHLDHRDIPLTETKDPLKWFLDIVPKCDYFIFFQLPSPENIVCVPPGIYSSQKMAMENIFKIFENSSRIINVELDSCPCEEIWVCSKLKSRYKYILPKGLCELVGKEDPFRSLLGARLKQSIADCIQEIKSPKEKVIPIVDCGKESPSKKSNVDEEKDTEEEEGIQIVLSDRRCLLESFHLDGNISDSSSD